MRQEAEAKRLAREYAAKQKKAEAERKAKQAARNAKKKYSDCVSKYGPARNSKCGPNPADAGKPKKKSWFSQATSAVGNHFKNNWRTYASWGVGIVAVTAGIACGASVVCGIAVGVGAGMGSYAASTGGTKSFSGKQLVLRGVLGGVLGGFGARLTAGKNAYLDTLPAGVTATMGQTYRNAIPGAFTAPWQWLPKFKQ
jgi:hypothetical protein